jgi:hypothetical protein
MEGYLTYYNYFKPNEALKGKTPAEVAKVDYQIKNWKDLSQIPVSKETEVKSHNRVGTVLKKIKPPKPKLLHIRSNVIDIGGGIEINKRTGRGHIKL